MPPLKVFQTFYAIAVESTHEHATQSIFQHQRKSVIDFFYTWQIVHGTIKTGDAMISKKNYRSFSALVTGFATDENGGELVEAALVIGLITIICIAAMKGVGLSVSLRWNEMMDSM